MGQSFAKYSSVKNIKIAEGTINYKQPDFKIMAMYKNDGNGDIEMDTMPESGYTINESKSYCTLDNINKDPKAKLFTNEEGKHVISGLSKNSKCYLYFDKVVPRNIKTEIIASLNNGTPDFSKSAQETCKNTATCETTNGLYKAKDNDGITYYFRGTVKNNYVKFAGFWWRIIRINGDGSIRLIYQGTSKESTGTNTQITLNGVNTFKFTNYVNSNANNNAYVGFMYTFGQLRGLGTKSNVLTQLEIWYQSNLLNFTSKIDANAGFCGDRTPSTNNAVGNGAGGTGATESWYAAVRLYTNKAPILTCPNNSDLYTISSSNKGNKSLTYPIGLITADEAAMAGGVYALSTNESYYLFTGQDYWTISPYEFTARAPSVGAVKKDGQVVSSVVSHSFGIRPVINLKSSTTFTVKGSISNPYVVN